MTNIFRDCDLVLPGGGFSAFWFELGCAYDRVNEHTRVGGWSAGVLAAIALLCIERGPHIEDRIIFFSKVRDARSSSTGESEASNRTYVVPLPRHTVALRCAPALFRQVTYTGNDDLSVSTCSLSLAQQV